MTGEPCVGQAVSSSEPCPPSPRWGGPLACVLPPGASSTQLASAASSAQAAGSCWQGSVTPLRTNASSASTCPASRKLPSSCCCPRDPASRELLCSSSASGASSWAPPGGSAAAGQLPCCPVRLDSRAASYRARAS